MAKLNNSLLGFPIPEKIVGEVDAAMKGIPKEVRDHFKSTVTDDSGASHNVEGYARRIMATKAMDFVDNERADISVVSSDSVDADKEIVAPGGLDWSQFLKSPSVSLSHNYKIPRVGKCQWVKRQMLDGGEDAWKAKTQYIARPLDFPAGQEWIPETTWFYVREMCLPAKSIGFIPMGMRPVTKEDERSNPDSARAKYVITKALVMEYSVCNLPVNPDSFVEAVGKMRAKGIVDRALLDAMGFVIPEATAKTIESSEEIEVEPAVAPILPSISDDVIRAHVERQAKSIIDGMDLSKTIADAFKSRLDDELSRAMGRV